MKFGLKSSLSPAQIAVVERLIERLGSTEPEARATCPYCRGTGRCDEYNECGFCD